MGRNISCDKSFLKTRKLYGTTVFISIRKNSPFSTASTQAYSDGYLPIPQNLPI